MRSIIYNEELLDNKNHINTIVSRANILIIEDNKQTLAYLNKELKIYYNIFRASTILEAMKALETYEIDLILSETKTPEIDGYIFCRFIKTSKQFAHLPLIFLTDNENTLEQVTSGSDVSISKTLHIDIIHAQIQNTLQNRQIVKNYFSKTEHFKNHELSSKDSENSFLKKLSIVIDEMRLDSNFTVDHLAKAMNMSRSTLYRKTKEHSSLKPNEIIFRSKLNAASILLTQGIYSVTQVANMSGYSLQANFSRDFKKHFGVSPSKYAELI